MSGAVGVCGEWSSGCVWMRGGVARSRRGARGGWRRGVARGLVQLCSASSRPRDDASAGGTAVPLRHVVAEGGMCGVGAPPGHRRTRRRVVCSLFMAYAHRDRDTEHREHTLAERLATMPAPPGVAPSPRIAICRTSVIRHEEPLTYSYSLLREQGWKPLRNNNRRKNGGRRSPRRGHRPLPPAPPVPGLT